MKVGIIGGTGRMGSLFSSVFIRAGHEVLISGRKTELTKEEIAHLCDIVMVSVPIHETVRIIGEISGFMRKEQIFCDLTSLKVAPVNAMLHSRSEVIGLHPMFGPTVDSITGQTIIVTPVRSSEKSIHLLTDIFRSQGATITVTTPEYHDRMMAVIQGLTHFKALVLAETMRRLNISPKDTAPFMSPVYRIEMNIAGRLLGQDPMLYNDILTHNDAVNEVLETCSESVSALKKIVTEKNSDQFTAFFLENRRWFGEFCDQALDETDHLIRSMVER